MKFDSVRDKNCIKPINGLAGQLNMCLAAWRSGRPWRGTVMLSQMWALTARSSLLPAVQTHLHELN